MPVPPLQLDRNEIVDLWNNHGLTQRQLAQKFGITVNSISGFLARMRNAGYPLAARQEKTLRTRIVTQRIAKIKEIDGSERKRNSVSAWNNFSHSRNRPKVRAEQYKPTIDPVELKKVTLICEDMLNVDLADLKRWQCRWPIDDRKYCGLDKVQPFVKDLGWSTRMIQPSYCPSHYKMSIRPPR